MAAVSAYFGKSVLREVDEAEFLRALPELRKVAGDRAVLRLSLIHIWVYFDKLL